VAVVPVVDLVDIQEAAVIAHRDPETIRRWVRRGRLVARKQGNRLLLPRADVERLAGTSGSRPLLSLADWTTQAARLRPTSGLASGPTAADLVLDDRARP
jgi:hypothetical protein